MTLANVPSDYDLAGKTLRFIETHLPISFETVVGLMFLYTPNVAYQNNNYASALNFNSNGCTLSLYEGAGGSVREIKIAEEGSFLSDTYTFPTDLGPIFIAREYEFFKEPVPSSNNNWQLKYAIIAE